MRDIRDGVCPLCAHQEIIEAVPAEFGYGNMERVSAVTYEPRWVLPGRNPVHPHGHLHLFVCRSCGFTQTFALEPEAVPIGERYRTSIIKGDAAEKGGEGRRRVETSYAAIHLGEAALEQDWPDGSLHRIVWAEPYTVEMHLEDLGEGSDLVDLHVRLVQSRQGGDRDIVAFTLRVPRASAPVITERRPASLPLIEGEDAVKILGLLKASAGAGLT